MNSSHEAVPAEKRLCELLDALEDGLLRLRQERDQLRETLAGVGEPPAPSKPKARPAKKRAKPAKKKAKPPKKTAPKPA